MTRLSFEATRCAGRRDLTPDTEICPMRNGCLRYLTAVVGDYGPDTPTRRWLCELPRFEQRIAPPAGVAAADAQALAAWREIRGVVVGADALPPPQQRKVNPIMTTTAMTPSVSAEAPAGPPAGPVLRLPGTDKPGVYKPAHQGRYVASWGSRSCGVCGVHKPLQGTQWTRHKVRGWVADCCNGRAVAAPVVAGA